jgi:hypothetical protein
LSGTVASAPPPAPLPPACPNICSKAASISPRIQSNLYKGCEVWVDAYVFQWKIGLLSGNFKPKLGILREIAPTLIRTSNPISGPMEEEAGQLCVRCKEKPAVYKCPGCNRRSCSATCSTEHKEVFSCSGKRNKAAYVPLNKYTWGSMMDDYTYLEDCGRQISEWGKTIAAQRLPAPPKSKHVKHHQHRRSTKREIFQAHLASMNIHMELAPLGMQRQTLNRSNMK